MDSKKISHEIFNALNKDGVTLRSLSLFVIEGIIDRAILAEPIDEENHQLREMLAMCYAGNVLYGDDGELQDNRWPPIDFRRDTVREIDRKMIERLALKLQKEAQQ